MPESAVPFLIPRSELDWRLGRLRAALDATSPEWRLAAVMHPVNLYYLTGTMPNGLLLVPRDGEAVLFARRAYSRAVEESAFPDIRPMRSFRDAAAALGSVPETIHIEREAIPVAHLERFAKYFPARQFAGLDQAIGMARAVKSSLELELMTRCGDIHRRAFEEIAPRLLRYGMSEAELGTELLAAMLAGGHEGVCRISMFGGELFLGSICFGENSLVTNPFDGPDGVRGFGPGVPVFGNRERRLRPGDLVFIDCGCCVAGYHTDKSIVFSCGEPAPEVRAAHARCLAVQNAAAAMMKPGVLASAVYEGTVGQLDEEFREHFMGYADQNVRFLGHGIGLHIDELPVLAKGFDVPLEANMTIALEPKKGLAGIGLVGTENTFVVTPEGGKSLTGGETELPVVHPA
jgi:Xaa-Pro aminopeptidase